MQPSCSLAADELRADELRAWLRLAHSPGLGPSAARRLLTAYGSPEGVIAAGAGGWREVGGFEAAQALQQPVKDHEALAAATEAWLAAEPGSRHVLTLGDPAYPAGLLETADPPLLLYAQGRLGLLALPSIAIVGSRHATPGGLDNARAFAQHLSRSGMVVVSGLAQGIDGAAHEGALDGASDAGGGTIAVVGTGLDRVYPKCHHALAHRISAAAGLMLSEFALGSMPLKSHFPRRNRIFAGLTLGTLVVEAAVQSGSLITARLAVECGREVFAIPGSIHSPQSRGCHRLIKDGAKLVETADDIVQELHLPVRPGAPAASPSKAAPAEASPLRTALGHDPVTLDALSDRLGWPAAELQARLLEMELDGRLVRLPGGLFQRRAHG
jgi:DNA processing protein